MLRSILIVLHGSSPDSAAIELGINWARQFRASLVGTGAIDDARIRKPEPVPIGGTECKKQRDEALLAEARTEVMHSLERFSKQCAAAGVRFETLRDFALSAQAICLEAQRHDAIIIGKQTFCESESQDQFQSDGTLAAVLKQSPRPVVTAPTTMKETRGPVLIAYDGSLQAARTLQVFLASGLCQGMDVRVVSAHADHGEAVQRGQRALDFLALHEVAAEFHAVSSSRPASTIIELAGQLDAALLVMGAYGKPAIQEFFFGSVTRTMLEEHVAPLFLYH